MDNPDEMDDFRHTVKLARQTIKRLVAIEKILIQQGVVTKDDIDKIVAHIDNMEG